MKSELSEIKMTSGFSKAIVNFLCSERGMIMPQIAELMEVPIDLITEISKENDGFTVGQLIAVERKEENLCRQMIDDLIKKHGGVPKELEEVYKSFVKVMEAFNKLKEFQKNENR